jgi:2-phospho-L-lactate guanylyltransferase
VISSDARALAVARELGAEPLVERGQGLNHALYLGRRWAMERACAEVLLVILSDLPWLASADLEALLALASRASVVIAPSKDGGTNALLLRPPHAIPFRFGPDSAARHAAAAQERGLPVALARSPGLAFDVDTPDDVRIACEASLAPAR